MVLEELQHLDIYNRKQLQHCDHLNAVINETLRLHPPVPTGGYRQTPPSGLIVGNAYVPGNVTIVSPTRWTTRPNMLKDARGVSPFAQGRYGCIGKTLAMIEMRFVIALLVRKFRISLSGVDKAETLFSDLRDQFTAASGRLELRASAATSPAGTTAERGVRRLKRISNGILANQFITTQLGRFILAFLFTSTVLFVYTSRIQHLFTVKSAVLPHTGLGLVIWATKDNGGVASGTLDTQAQSAKAPVSVLVWAIVSQFNSVIDSNSALLVTSPDIARYSKTRNPQIWDELIALRTWADSMRSLWNNHYARAGAFFASASFAFATLRTSIACNSILFVADVTCMLPTYLNIVRSHLLALVIAFAIVPWRIVAWVPGSSTSSAVTLSSRGRRSPS
ncbi:Uu.00g008340.m01.CDS01 [Anthostomella pinea]|uniref:Uu.00g008340.m01.CDS01 n=1 Tax=Anthostomella pinea TaxID=933095 RepID=A0AAI8VXU0_9PEZI|nr:Uu.00g008340.m01.CDS01 [Anthostomella pinea]